MCGIKPHITHVGDVSECFQMWNLWNVKISKNFRQFQCAQEMYSILEYGKAPQKAFEVAE